MFRNRRLTPSGSHIAGNVFWRFFRPRWGRIFLSTNMSAECFSIPSGVHIVGDNMFWDGFVFRPQRGRISVANMFRNVFSIPAESRIAGDKYFSNHLPTPSGSHIARNVFWRVFSTLSGSHIGGDKCVLEWFLPPVTSHNVG